MSLPNMVLTSKFLDYSKLNDKTIIDMINNKITIFNKDIDLYLV